MEGAHQEIAGAADAVSRKHASRPIGAVSRRSESDNQHPGPWIPEPRHRARPIDFIPKGASLLAPDALTIRPQSRAALAGDDRRLRRPQISIVAADLEVHTTNALTLLTRAAPNALSPAHLALTSRPEDGACPCGDDDPVAIVGDTNRRAVSSRLNGRAMGLSNI
jgi:hypothetical protein